MNTNRGHVIRLTLKLTVVLLLTVVVTIAVTRATRYAARVRADERYDALHTREHVIRTDPDLSDAEREEQLDVVRRELAELDHSHKPQPTAAATRGN